MNSTRPQCPAVPGTTFRPVRDWNTIRDTTPPMYLTLTGIHLRLSTKARLCEDLFLKFSSGTLAQHLEATNVRHREGRSVYLQKVSR